MTITDGGQTFNVQSDVFTVGAGYLDIQAALMNKEKAQGVAKSPTAAYDATSGNVYFVADMQTPWGAGCYVERTLSDSRYDDVGGCYGVGRRRFPGEFRYVGQFRYVR